MFFYSLKNKARKVTFKKALMDGLASDGSLYYPEQFPKFSKTEIKEIFGKSLEEIGFIVFKKWFGDEIEDKSLREITEKSLDFPIPIKKLEDYYVLELFHGPTMAFKDVAAKCLGNLMDYFLKKEKKSATILVATSGDTGGAVAQGFKDVKNVKVVILFPKGKVSRFQEFQLTNVSKNVFPLEINGSFDDCQSLVKKAFVDRTLSKLNLTSANSINIGRLIPQIIYYIYVYSRLRKNNIEFIVPTGNMGNITAGFFAHEMNFPFNSFILATNSNNSIVGYYKSSIYKPKKTVRTLSNAMDVADPSNFARVLELFKGNHSKFKEIAKAIDINDEETIETIKRIYKKHNYLIDPHTAVAFAAMEKISDSKRTKVLISTASPIKFSSEIKKATSIEISDEEFLKKNFKNKRKYSLRKNYSDLKSFLKKLH